MNDQSPCRRIVFDRTLVEPRRVQIRADYDCSASVSLLFDSDTWLVSSASSAKARTIKQGLLLNLIDRVHDLHCSSRHTALPLSEGTPSTQENRDV